LWKTALWHIFCKFLAIKKFKIYKSVLFSSASY
jgi:hypothetical protein